MMGAGRRGRQQVEIAFRRDDMRRGRRDVLAVVPGLGKVPCVGIDRHWPVIEADELEFDAEFVQSAFDAAGRAACTAEQIGDELLAGHYAGTLRLVAEKGTI